MKSIKFANGREFEIIECYNNGRRYINGETRVCREIVLADDVISLDELKSILKNPVNLETIEVYMNVAVEAEGENGEIIIEQMEDTEVLKNYVYADEIKDNMKGEITFIIGEKSTIEMENEQALQTIDELLIAMEV